MPRRPAPSSLVTTGGVVSRAELVAAGYDDDAGDHRVRTGAWRRLAPSTYLTCAGTPTDGHLVRAASLHAPHAVVTGLVACRALDLRDVPTEPVIELLLPRGTRSVGSEHIVIHQTASALPTWVWAGSRLALPERAVVDGARRVADLRTARALVLSAVCQGHVSAADLRAQLEAGSRRGSGLTRRVIDDAAAGAWSAPEAEAADLVRAEVRRGRLPPFLLNPQLTRGGRLIGRPDGYVVGTGVGWQVDSRRHHGGEDDFDRTLAVHDTFAAHGLTLLHVTPRRLRQEGGAWIEALVAAVAARGPATEPLQLVVELTGPLQTGRRPGRTAPAQA